LSDPITDLAGSSSVFRRSIGSARIVSGIGLHSGSPGRVRLEPSPFGTGLVLEGWHDPRARSMVSLDVASAPGGCSVIENSSLCVQTTEHFLAAVVSLGLTDLKVVVDGAELPGLDGSAGPWCAALMQAGIEEGPALTPWCVTEPFTLEAHGGRVTLRPHPGLRVEVAVDQGPRVRGRCVVDLPEPTSGGPFAHEWSWARTFVHVEEVGRLRSMGRGEGATRGNTLLLDDRHPATVRMTDEPVVHKLVDAVGDVGLLGAPLRGHMVVENGSHALHQEALKMWYQQQGGRTCHSDA
jgi:UDP-3-O-[3-hydroxymyristoyl] N-acetylglucosamine deacetylase